jgi:hypothetical protein
MKNFGLKMMVIATMFGSGMAKADAPEMVNLGGLTAGGTGCPAGSVNVSLDDTYGALSFVMDQFVVEVGAGVPINQSRKFCQISLDLPAPEGWQYALTGVTVRGFADLDSGLVATVQAQTYFSGQTETASVEEEISGPESSSYELNAEWAPEELSWSPCGASRALNIKTAIRINPAGQRNKSGVVTADEKSFQAYSIVWKRCE